MSYPPPPTSAHPSPQPFSGALPLHTQLQFINLANAFPEFTLKIFQIVPYCEERERERQTDRQTDRQTETELRTQNWFIQALAHKQGDTFLAKPDTFARAHKYIHTRARIHTPCTHTHTHIRTHTNIHIRTQYSIVSTGTSDNKMFNIVQEIHFSLYRDASSTCSLNNLLDAYCLSIWSMPRVKM